MATCELVDVAPIGASSDFPIASDGYEDYDAAPLVVVYHQALARLPESLVLDDRGKTTTITDQLPYGDFRPGRFAWLLADVKPIEPVPARGRQGLWEWVGQPSEGQQP